MESFIAYPINFCVFKTLMISEIICVFVHQSLLKHPNNYVKTAAWESQFWIYNLCIEQKYLFLSSLAMKVLS